MTLAAALACGCGEGMPFQLEPVQGTVKYEDGSLIPADQIRVVFEPQDLQPVGRVAPAAAQAYVDVTDGSFEELTTWEYGDGAIVGRHKVRVVSLRTHPGGMEPTTVVPPAYHRAESTPLEVEVVRGGPNHFDLQIARRM